MTVRIAFLRHGHTAWNRAHQIQGRTDIPLDAEGRATLENLRLPKPWDQADLWSSPLSRAVETAQLVAGEPQISDVLIEMDWGTWEGQKGRVLQADPSVDFRDIEDWGWDYTPPDGESPRDVWNRLNPWLESLVNDAVVVAHMGILRVALAVATGWNFAGPCPFSIKRNRLFIISKTDDGWTLSGDPVRLEARS